MIAIDVVVAGLVATALADLWQQGLKRVLCLPIANWRMIGRWVAWMPRGVFAHRPIAATAALPGEEAIGWAFHYAVGVAYAGLYLALIEIVPGVGPGLSSALAFGLATLLAPWFVMQPALGFGIMGRALPNRLSVRFVTVTTHLAFGFGLYVGLLASSLAGGRNSVDVV